MAAAESTAVVPFFYRFFFQNVDPLIALWGAYLNLADPSAAVRASAPASTYDPRQVFLFHQAGGLALAVAVLSALVPRRSRDLGVWRALQLALLLSDFAGLSGIYHGLEVQGRLRPGAWTADDWALAGSYALLTAVRALFLLGVGFGGAPAAPATKAV
ncbi:beta-mannosidase mndA [Cordyceps fumosorosea ARSEF 2679]|uniref:Beta-mannosidase mndA n=1 Tax=Cordyceps fumosorosea (strain ARSEF 2679) TaxID=1081104 RepID=A0A167ACY6_CORFA|nr:beta-mannosidase mndA [Cordyceps fumosorosea ARSEF 2679]OAA38786.1 beta-mannosidase mndA [Cordyceps fumosorosea ARSEF 2679]